MQNGAELESLVYSDLGRPGVGESQTLAKSAADAMPDRSGARRLPSP
jgi:hypothetical protein